VRGLTVHAALLVAALAVAFLTWTSGEAPQADASLIEIWNRDPARLVQVDYRSAARTLTVERRERQEGGYLWGIETTSQPAAPAADSAAPVLPAQPPPVDSYPVSADGDTLFRRFARLQAVRDLGVPGATDSAAFGVKDAADTVVLHFHDGEQRRLALGADVVGGGDRYVLDLTAGRIYVLPSDLLQPLTVPTSLRRQRLQDFSPSEISRVVLRAGGTERVMQRTPTRFDSSRGEYRAPGSEQTDQAFTNFMSQLDGLWVEHFREDVNVDTLQAIVRVDYLDEGGATLGTIQLYRTSATNSPNPYFLRTAATVVAGEAYVPAAQRIEQDVRTLFSGNQPANTPSASQ